MSPGEWSAVIAGIMLALAIGGVVWRASASASVGRAALVVAKEAKDAAAKAETKADKARDDLASYREYVAGKYISHDEMNTMKIEILASIKEVRDTLKQLFVPRGSTEQG